MICFSLTITLYSYQAYNGESVVLLAGVELPVDQFTAVTDPYVLSLLQPQVKDEIVQVSIYYFFLLVWLSM